MWTPPVARLPVARSSVAHSPVYSPAHSDVRPDASIRWHLAASDTNDALREHVVAVGKCEASNVRVGRLCAVCASSKHGQPWSTPLGHVSIARSGPHLVTAVSLAGPIGIDVESVDAVTQRDVEVLHPSETASTADDVAATWVRKEAILKMLGRGLLLPMRHVRFAEYDVRDLPAPDGFRAALAVSESVGVSDSVTVSESVTGR